MTTEVFELGEDSDRWMVVGTTEVDAARLAVINFLHAALLPGDEAAFAYGVQETLNAEVQVIDECRIFGDPATDAAFYESPIGPGARSMVAPGKYETFSLIGRNAVVLGVRLPEHRDYLAKATDRENGSER